MQFTKREMKDMRKRQRDEWQQRADQMDDMKGLQAMLSGSMGKKKQQRDDEEEVGEKKKGKFEKSLKKMGGSGGKRE